MLESLQVLADKFKWYIAGLIAAALLTSISLLIPVPQPLSSVEADVSSDYSMGMTDSPNAVTSLFAAAGQQSDAFIDGTGQAIDSTRLAYNQAVLAGANTIWLGVTFVGKTIGMIAIFAGKTIGSVIMFGVHTVGSVLSFTGQVIGTAASFSARIVSGSIGMILQVPRSTLSFAADTAIARAVIKPASITSAPVIESVPTPVAATAAEQLPNALTAIEAPLVPAITATWPIRGEVTTWFGVAHWPYQATHSGIDISDGKPSGVTAIKPFKPGKVVDTVHYYAGLGNHVIIDHGNGMTSVYAHLASISVQPGQQVTQDTVLGFEGTTGASTGTHLHFEIRINDAPVDPRQYINGLPE